MKGLERARLSARGAVDAAISRLKNIPGGTVWERSDKDTGQTTQLHRRSHYDSFRGASAGVLHPDGRATIGNNSDIVHVRDAQTRRISERFTLGDPPADSDVKKLEGLEILDLQRRPYMERHGPQAVFNFDAATVNRQLHGPKGDPLKLVQFGLRHFRRD